MNRASFLRALGLAALASRLEAGEDIEGINFEPLKVRTRVEGREHEGRKEHTFDVPVPESIEGLRSIMTDQEILDYAMQTLKIRYQTVARVAIKHGGVETKEEIERAVRNYNPGPQGRRLPGQHLL